MPKLFTPAAGDVMKRVAALIEKYHPALKSYRVAVEVLMVSNTKGGHALMLHGMPCYGVVRALTTKERAAGRGDAEILIERDCYAAMSEKQRDALLDHELEHLDVKLDRDGDLKQDTNGRPCLKMKKHDYEVGWFHEIARRHGEASFEVSQARKLLSRHGQLYFDFDGAGSAPLGRLQELATAAREVEVESVTITHDDKVVHINSQGITTKKAGKKAAAKANA